jgi:hypothetical protein
MIDDIHLVRTILEILGGSVAFCSIVVLILRKTKAFKFDVASSFQLFSSILLFGFLLSLIGMFLFVGTRLFDSIQGLSKDLTDSKSKNIELSNTQQGLAAQNKQLLGQHNDLLNKVSKIQEFALKTQSSSVEILRTDLTFDLRGWKPVPESDRDTKRESLVTLKIRRQLWKAKVEFTRFPATFATSTKLPPEFRSNDAHALEPVVNTDPIPSNKETLFRWILYSDISNEQRFKPFDVLTEIHEWNSMQNPFQEHQGTLILFPTRAVTMTVIFPPDKPAKRDLIKCYYYGLDDTSKKPFTNPALKWSDDGSSLTWSIEDPRLLIHYEIWWDW